MKDRGRWFKVYEEQVKEDMFFFKWLSEKHPEIIKEYEEINDH